MCRTEQYGAGPVRDAVRSLNPGYFALVMATGIVSVGMVAHGQRAVSVLLLWLAGIGYAVLVVLSGWRLASFHPDIAADF
ncbi:MAG TPA: hypothetical protein VKB37_14005, partial [Jatrophihabitantaceae bacterium]|nr:hypothetical protein [Jatrophihabitantaceae bacterium]